MSDLGQLKVLIHALPCPEFAELRDWLAGRGQTVWDQQIAKGAESGKHEQLIDEAREEWDRSDDRQREAMLLVDVLRYYLLLFSEPRYRSHSAIPDGSPILDCLAYGLSKLVEDIARCRNLSFNEKQMRALHDLDARVSQVAVSSKKWSSAEEWDGATHSAWVLIEALGWDQAEADA